MLLRQLSRVPRMAENVRRDPATPPRGASAPPLPQLFVDLDGVLADFDASAEVHLGYRPQLAETDKLKKKDMWRRLSPNSPACVCRNFFEQLPLMPGAERLWERARRHNAVVLTGCPSGGWAEPQKHAWCARVLGLAPDTGDSAGLGTGAGAGAGPGAPEDAGESGESSTVTSTTTAAASAGGYTRVQRVLTCHKRDKAATAAAWLAAHGRPGQGAVLVDDLLEQKSWWEGFGGASMTALAAAAPASSVGAEASTAASTSASASLSDSASPPARAAAPFVFVHHRSVDESLRLLSELGFGDDGEDRGEGGNGPEAAASVANAGR